jgi:integrase
LRVARKDFGIGVTKAEVSELTGQIDIGALREYRDAVGWRTRDIVNGFGAADWQGEVTAIRSEVLPLERRQLDLKAGTLRLEPGTTKNRDGRVVYLTPELKALLAAQIERVDAVQRKLQRIVPFVFPHLEGRHCGALRCGFRKAWRTACARAGVPGRIPHDFRRTAVRNMERAGVPRSVAVKLTGHRTESVYRRYAIVSDADLQEAARKLAEASVTQRAGTFAGTFERSKVAPVR